jgi:protein-S-isoprenylcysteine O-methyltransferase Ste14
MQDGMLRVPGAAPSSLERIGAFLFAWRNWVFTAGLLALLAGFRPVPLFGSREADLWLDLFGFALSVAGQGIRIAVIGYSAIESGGQKKKVTAQRLVTCGLLSHVRNPLYLANLLVVAGLAVIHNNPWVYAVAIPVTVFGYVAIVAAEEAHLSGRFGKEYAEYCRRVPRWVPNLRGLHRSLAGIPFESRRVILQEYGSIYIAVALPLLLMLYQQLPGPGSSPERVRLWVLVALFVLATAAWAWLRRVKVHEVARRRAAAAES